MLFHTVGANPASRATTIPRPSHSHTVSRSAFEKAIGCHPSGGAGLAGAALATGASTMGSPMTASELEIDELFGAWLGDHEQIDNHDKGQTDPHRLPQHNVAQL